LDIHFLSTYYRKSAQVGDIKETLLGSGEDGSQGEETRYTCTENQSYLSMAELWNSSSEDVR
jgi:hypothetical protein